jgi:hypothetical protein
LIGTKAWLQVITSTNRLTIVYRRMIRPLQEAEPLLLESRAQGPLC